MAKNKKKDGGRKGGGKKNKGGGNRQQAAERAQSHKKKSGGGNKGGGNDQVQANAQQSQSSSQQQQNNQQQSQGSGGQEQQRYTSKNKNLNSTYNNTSEKYQERFSREEHQERRRGMKDVKKGLREGKTQEELMQENIEGGLENYDPRLGGRGGYLGNKYDEEGKTLGGGADKLSAADLKSLKESGKYSYEELEEYVQGLEESYNDGSGTTRVGGRTKELLDQYKKEFMDSQIPEEDEDDDGGGSGGESGGGSGGESGGGSGGNEGGDEGGGSGGSSGGNTGTNQSVNEINTGGDGEQTDDTLVGGGLGAGSGNNVAGDGNAVGVGNNAGQNTEIDESFNGGTVSTGDITAGGNVSIDNSNNSRYYGGNNSMTNIVYGAGYGRYNTNPVGDMTMAGMGKADDSPAAQAKFVDFYQQLNRDAQQRYHGGEAPSAARYINMARGVNPIDYDKLNQSITDRINTHYNNSATIQDKYQGDTGNYKTPEYQMPEPPKPIENNLDEIAEDYGDKDKNK